MYYGGAVMYNKVSICGVDTSKLPTLKESEKTELLKEVKQGNKSAREQLINGNLRLVLSVIQRFGGRGENYERRIYILWQFRLFAEKLTARKQASSPLTRIFSLS